MIVTNLSFLPLPNWSNTICLNFGSVWMCGNRPCKSVCGVSVCERRMKLLVFFSAIMHWWWHWYLWRILALRGARATLTRLSLSLSLRTALLLCCSEYCDVRFLYKIYHFLYLLLYIKVSLFVHFSFLSFALALTLILILILVLILVLVLGFGLAFATVVYEYNGIICIFPRKKGM